MENAKVAEAEARQAAQHDAVKSRVETHVNAEIAGQAAAVSADEHARVDAVAAQMRHSAIDETVHGERVLGQARVAARGSQFIDYAFYIIYTLLAVRLGLAFIAARSATGFVQFIDSVTNPLYAPFRGIVPSLAVGGGFTLVIPIVIAIVAYAMLHAAINAMLRMVGERKTVI
jgi:uncharacterized protein YggT (Ycf19 family)